MGTNASACHHRCIIMQSVKKTGPGIKTELQLGSSYATYYYLNPNIPEATNSILEYRQRYEADPPLQVIKQKLQDKELENMRNRHPLQELIHRNPQNYKHVRFTNNATIISINTSRPWYYKACNECNKKVNPTGDSYNCEKHGPKSQPTYRYCFRAIIDDSTATANMTFFTPNADSMLGFPCAELAKTNPNPYDTPAQILNLIGQKCLFRFHYNTNPGAIELIFDEQLDTKNKSQIQATQSTPQALTETSHTPHPPETPTVAQENKEPKPKAAKRNHFNESTETSKKTKIE